MRILPALAPLALLALLALLAAASLARADAVDDLAQQALGTAHDAAGAAAPLAQQAVADANGAAQEAAQQGADTANAAVGTANGAAQQGLDTAGQLSSDAIAQASQVPAAVPPAYAHATGIALREAHIAGDYAQRRLGGVPALDEPWLLGLNAYGPYLDQLGGALTLSFSLENLDLSLGLPDPVPHLPPPGAVVATTLDYATGNVAHTQAWAADAAADTLVTAQAALDAAQG